MDSRQHTVNAREFNRLKRQGCGSSSPATESRKEPALVMNTTRQMPSSAHVCTRGHSGATNVSRF
jgi:hypothetical protein